MCWLHLEYTWHETLKSRRGGQGRRSVRDRRRTDARIPLFKTLHFTKTTKELLQTDKLFPLMSVYKGVKADLFVLTGGNFYKQTPIPGKERHRVQ